MQRWRHWEGVKMNKMDEMFLDIIDAHIVFNAWHHKSYVNNTANTAWQEHVATLDVAREYWG